MSANFITYIPKVKIVNKKILGEDYNIGEFVRTASGQSSLGQPANTIVLQLEPSASNSYPGYVGVHSVPYWAKTIKKGDVISVGIETEHSWLYRIDSVRRTKRLSPNGSETSIRILGRSMSSVLLDDDIVFAPELAQNPRSLKLLGALRASFLGFLGGLRGLSIAGVSQFLDGNPIAAILWIFINMPSINSKIFYVDYDEKGNPLSSYTEKIGNLFDFEFMMYEKDLLYNVELNQYTGKVWNYIEQCLDPMFYELFEETKVVNGVLKPTIIIRPKPFDRTTDRAEVINSKIIRLKVERNGDISQGDFIITPHPVTVGEETATIYDVGVKGFDSSKDTYDETVERVSLFWDNENTPATSDNKQAYISLNDPQNNQIKNPSTGNAFVTCVTNELFHTVDESEDYEFDLGSTTKDIVNFITMHAMKDLGFTEQLATLGFMYPLIDSNSVLQWGSRRMEAHTLMMHAQATDWTEDYNKDFIQKPVPGAKVYPLDAAVKLRERIFSWYRYNPLFLSGTSRVLGHDYYRRGDKIYYPHHLSDEGYTEGMYYYIQGSYWTFNVDQGSANYITTLDLIRGENKQSLQEYRLNAGYDLYDRDIESENGRENPVLKIDVILDVQPDGTTQGKTNVETQPVVKTDIAEDDPENPEKNGMAFQQGLTQTAHDHFKKKLGDEALDTLIKTAAKYAINPNVLVGLMDHESVGLNPDAKSSTGCLGLGQFCYATAKEMKAFSEGVETITVKCLSNDIRRNPIQSIKAVGELLSRNGYYANPVWAIMSYGDNNQNSFFGLIADNVARFQTGVFSGADKRWASSNYGRLQSKKPKPKPKKK